MVIGEEKRRCGAGIYKSPWGCQPPDYLNWTDHGFRRVDMCQPPERMFAVMDISHSSSDSRDICAVVISVSARPLQDDTNGTRSYMM